MKADSSARAKLRDCVIKLSSIRVNKHPPADSGRNRGRHEWLTYRPNTEQPRGLQRFESRFHSPVPLVLTDGGDQGLRPHRSISARTARS